MNFKLLIFTLPIIAFSLTGCVNNSEEGLYGDDCDTLNMTYPKVKYIFEVNCYSCHNQTTNNHDIILTSYSNLKAAVNTGKLEPAINWTGEWHMPKDQDQLNECQIAMIGAWINAGMPE